MNFCIGYVLKCQGHDTSLVQSISYQNHPELVRDYKIGLRGYPLTADGRMVRPSDFPGGIKGLSHADEQLGSGAWGFEIISDSLYKEWRSQCDQAEAVKQPWPIAPYIPVPGSEYKKPAREGPSTSKRKAADSKQKGKTVTKKTRQASGNGKLTKKQNKVKSSEIIEDSDSDTEPDLESGSSHDDPLSDLNDASA
jgi:hypothetical protein